MTAVLTGSLQAAAVQTQLATLPLRQDDPVSWMLMIKVLLITAILLAMTYVGLRWYARRQGQGQRAANQPELQCTSVLRLSSRTKVYLVRSSKSEVLITESSTGTSVTVLPGGISASVPSAPKPKSR